MVRTEADGVIHQLIFHLINHLYIIHHRGILYNILNLMNLSTKRNCTIPSINTMIMKMKGWFMEGEGGPLTLILIGEKEFWTLIGEIDFLILFVIKEDTQTLMSLGSLLLMGILILSDPCFGLMKLIRTWRRMRRLLRDKFLSPDCH